MSIQNGDLLDEGLQSVMGKDRCQNEWKPSKKPMVEPFTRPAEEEKKARKTTETAVDASWAPAKNPNWMDKLKDTAKWVIGFGGLSFIIFYWNGNGLMDSVIAIPAMCVCTALAGYGVGKHAFRQ